MEAYDIVLAARGKDRLTASDYIKGFVDDFLEFHGDRRFGDDHAIIGGIGTMNGIPITVIGIEKGKDVKERIYHNFGSAHPEGYRKALRLMKQAEKFHRPILCLVDTAGAYCGVESEERGQGQAIAENLLELSNLKTPMLSIIIGEGGSGGALALAQTDRVWMLDTSYFSVVSPENCANILWRDSSKASQAATDLKLAAMDLYQLHLIDQVYPSLNVDATKEEQKNYMLEFKQHILDEIILLKKKTVEQLVEERYEKYRQIGRTTEERV